MTNRHENLTAKPTKGMQSANTDYSRPDPHEPGKFGRECTDEQALCDARWAGHDQITSHVLAGSYHEIQPVAAEFIPTIRCNFFHSFCSQKAQRIRFGVWGPLAPPNPNTDMTNERAEHYLATMAQGGVKAVLLTGGGEPTMAENLSHIIGYAKNLGLALGMITNATFQGNVSPEDIIGPADFVRISLNSMRNHAKCCGYNPARRDYRAIVLKNIASISQARKANPGTMTKLFACTVVTKNTYDDLPELAKVICNSAFSAWILRPAIVYFGGPEKQVQEDTLLRAEEKVNELRPMLEDAGVKVYWPSHRRVSAGGAVRTYSQCRAAGFIGSVTHTGETFLDTETNYHEKFCIGDLNRQSWAEIYKGNRYRQVVDKVAELKCSKCPVTCRQNRLNTMLEKVEQLKTQPGGRELLERWVNALREEQLAHGGPNPWIEI